MNKTTNKKIINAIVYLILAMIAIAIFYATYMELVTQEKAEHIEVLREKLQKQREETERSQSSATR